MARWSGPNEGPGIHFVQGDLFYSTDSAIAHGVNMRGVMGAGIAREFRVKFPVMYGTYKALCEHDAVSVMGVMPWKVRQGQYVMNIFSQVEPGANAEVSRIFYGLIRSVNYLSDRGINRLSIPWIGAGIGGIDDRTLESELRHTGSILKDFTITVYDKVD
jgi:O-acetyl-ADP-ribose deacetylase (regulator of RNase III)